MTSVDTGSFPETQDIATSSDDYASRFSGPVGRWMLSVQAGLVLSMLQRSGAKSVLDVGGGHGQLAIPLADAGYDVTVVGSDPSCSKRIQEYVDSGKVRFIVGNVIDLPCIDGAYDAVVSVRLLPHCERWPELISEFCRASSKCVIVDYPAKHGFNAIAPLFFGAKKKLEKNTRTWRDFTNAEVRDEFAKNGFELSVRKGQFFLPMVLHRALKTKPASVVLEAPFKCLGLTRLWGSPVIAEFRPGS